MTPWDIDHSLNIEPSCLRTPSNCVGRFDDELIGISWSVIYVGEVITVFVDDLFPVALEVRKFSIIRCHICPCRIKKDCLLFPQNPWKNLFLLIPIPIFSLVSGQNLIFLWCVHGIRLPTSWGTVQIHYGVLVRLQIKSTMDSFPTCLRLSYIGRTPFCTLYHRDFFSGILR